MSNILNKKRNLLPFDGPWLDAIGKPELTGSWLIWGGSGSGKTTFTMQLCKYLTQFDRVLYNSLEEGDSESMKMAFLRTDMAAVQKRFLLLDKEPIEDLKVRLRKRKAPRIVVNDSVQYSGLNYMQYKLLIDEFRNTLFVLISHADGKLPAGRSAGRIRFDAMVKIRVEGYRAYCVSRYRDGEGAPIVIWDKGANEYKAL